MSESKYEIKVSTEANKKAFSELRENLTAAVDSRSNTLNDAVDRLHTVNWKLLTNRRERMMHDTFMAGSAWSLTYLLGHAYTKVSNNPVISRRGTMAMLFTGTLSSIAGALWYCPKTERVN